MTALISILHMGRQRLRKTYQRPPSEFRAESNWMTFLMLKETFRVLLWRLQQTSRVRAWLSSICEMNCRIHGCAILHESLIEKDVWLMEAVYLTLNETHCSNCLGIFTPFPFPGPSLNLQLSPLFCFSKRDICLHCQFSFLHLTLDISCLITVNKAWQLEG